MQLTGTTYEQVYDRFQWTVPERFNVAECCCLRHARGALRDAPALMFVRLDGTVDTYTFAQFSAYAARFANTLTHLGIARGDVVAIHLPQTPEAIIAHLGAQMVGAVVLPLFALFGSDAMRFRLTDSETRLLLTNHVGIERVGEALQEQPALDHVLCIDGAGPDGALGFWELMDNASSTAVTCDTRADDPAFLMSTSGTTGNPKGVLHAQRVLYGHLPGIVLPHEQFPQKGDKFWTPADWAWAGGLFDALLPSLYFGVPVVASQAERFDPEVAFDFMARHAIRNTFMPPTALRLMRKVPDARGRFGHDLRSIGTGGESLGEDMIAWGHDAFGLTLNEFYGQTEVNLVTGNSAGLFPTRPGSMGRALPGHTVEVVDSDGQPCPVGQDGIVAVRRPDPVMFLEYWKKPEATAAKFIGDWCLLGDVAQRDEDGYFWFRGRDDDIIISAGYRIGPSEVEECLMTHPGIVLAGVIGAPDETRGEIVVAYVVLADGVTESKALIADIQDHVRARLAAHEYPREVRVVHALPVTLTGKIKRRDLRLLEQARTS